MPLMSQSNFVSLCGYLSAAIHHDYRACANVLPKECSSKVSKIFKTYFLSYQRDKFVKTVVQPSSSLPEHQQLQPSSPFVDGEYFLHRITRKLGSTATSTVIAWLLPLPNFISGAENETQRALSGHTNGDIEMRSPSTGAMMTMVAAATIVRFPPVVTVAAVTVSAVTVVTPGIPLPAVGSGAPVHSIEKHEALFNMITQCYVMLCVICYSSYVTCHAMPCHAMPCQVMSWHVMAWHDMAWYGMAWHGMVWHGMHFLPYVFHGNKIALVLSNISAIFTTV